MTATVVIFMAVVIATYAGAYTPYQRPPRASMDTPAFGRSASPDFGSLHRYDGEALKPYLRRLTMAVNSYMVHYWPTGDSYAVGVHPLHNFPIWAKSYVPGYEHLTAKEFIDPRLAWQRGYGFCSQVSRIVYSVLREQGIPSTIIEHPNHVVVEADGMILDADYGVTIDANADQLRTKPDVIKSAYSAFPSMLPLLQSVYAAGWKPMATDANFDNTKAFEREAVRLQWEMLIALLWISVAILDAGICWKRWNPWRAALVHLRRATIRRRHRNVFSQAIGP